jgi:hypothetical protein
MTWVMVIWFWSGSSAGVMTNIPGYASEDECKLAADVMKATAKAARWVFPDAICVPGPRR